MGALSLLTCGCGLAVVSATLAGNGLVWVSGRTSTSVASLRASWIAVSMFIPIQ